jgi:hypothetical protein
MALKNMCWVFAVFILFFIAIQVSAQSADQSLLRPGIGTYIGPAVGNSAYGYGIGLDLLLIAELSDQLSITGSIGYARLLTKDTSPTPDYDFIPLKSTLKIFPIEQPAYFMGTIGAGFGIQKGSKTALIFGGGLGYRFLKDYDLAIKYEAYQQPPSSVTYQPLSGLLAATFAYRF